MGSPIKGGNFNPQLSGGMGMFGGQNNITLKTPDSPTMMVIDQNPDDVSIWRREGRGRGRGTEGGGEWKGKGGRGGGR